MKGPKTEMCLISLKSNAKIRDVVREIGEHRWNFLYEHYKDCKLNPERNEERL